MTSRVPETPSHRKRRRTYVNVASSTVRDRRLSFKARGILVYLLDMPENWDVRSEALAKASDKDGRDAVQSGLRELAVHGYYRLERRQQLDGTFRMGTAISEDPVPQWVEEYREYATTKSGNGAVPMIQQKDGTWRVKRKDGTLTLDGFDLPDLPPPPDAPTDPEDQETAGQTGNGKPGSGGDGAVPTGTGFSGTGSTGTGKPRALSTTEGSTTDEAKNPPSAVGGHVQVVGGGSSPADVGANASAASGVQAPADAGRKGISGQQQEGTDSPPSGPKTSATKTGGQQAKARTSPAGGDYESPRIDASVLRNAYRVLHLLPSDAIEGLSERQQRAVVQHIAAELGYRTADQLVARASRNWHAAFAGEQIRDRVGVCVRLVRRGLDCPDLRCEDGVLVDDGQQCQACVMVAEHETDPENLARRAWIDTLDLPDEPEPSDASPQAWEVFRALPADWRAGVDDWNARQMALRFQDLLKDGYTRIQILAVARDIPPQGRRGYLARLLQLSTSLRSARREGNLPEHCPDCRQKPFASGRCGCSTGEETMGETELEQLVRVQEVLGAV